MDSILIWVNLISLGSDSHIISIVHNSRPDQIQKLEVGLVINLSI